MWADAKCSFIILELIFVQFHYGHSNKQSLYVSVPPCTVFSGGLWPRSVGGCCYYQPGSFCSDPAWLNYHGIIISDKTHALVSFFSHKSCDYPLNWCFRCSATVLKGSPFTDKSILPVPVYKSSASKCILSKWKWVARSQRLGCIWDTVKPTGSGKYVHHRSMPNVSVLLHPNYICYKCKWPGFPSSVRISLCSHYRSIYSQVAPWHTCWTRLLFHDLGSYATWMKQGLTSLVTAKRTNRPRKDVLSQLPKKAKADSGMILWLDPHPNQRWGFRFHMGMFVKNMLVA